MFARKYTLKYLGITSATNTLKLFRGKKANVVKC